MQLSFINKFNQIFLNIFNIKYKKIIERSKVFALINSNKISSKEIRNFIEDTSKITKEIFPNINSSQLEFSEMRWQESYYELFFIKIYLKKIYNFHKLKKRNILKNFLIKISFTYIYLVLYSNNIRSQIKSSKSLPKESSLRIYIHNDISNNKSYEFSYKSLIYIHFPRHKSILNYISNFKDKIIVASPKIIFSEIDLKKFNIRLVQKIDTVDFKYAQSGFQLIYLLKIIKNFKYGGMKFYALFCNLIFTRSFLNYSALGAKLLKSYQFQNYFAFETFELTRIIFLNSKNFNLFVNYIFIYSWDINSNLIRRSSNVIYVSNRLLEKRFSQINNNVKLYQLNLNKISYQNFISRVPPNKNNILFLANKPSLSISVDDLRRNLKYTKFIAKKLNYNIIFRAHPVTTKEDVLNIYGDIITKEINFDTFDELKDSFTQARLISLGISTSGLEAINSSSICFCTGFDNNLKFYRKIYFDYVPIIKTQLCNDDYQYVYNNLKKILNSSKLKINYFKNIYNYLYSNNMNKETLLTLHEILN